MLLLSIQITDSDNAEGVDKIFCVEPSVRHSISESVRPVTETLVMHYFKIIENFTKQKKEYKLSNFQVGTPL